MYNASADGLAWKITALKLASFNRSNSFIASAFCSFVDKLRLDGQLILATVAIHAPLNSLLTAGSSTYRLSSIGFTSVGFL